MEDEMKTDEFASILATKPKHVTTWARRDVISFWLGRTVSAKHAHKQLQSPSLIGTIVEVGLAGWVTILWENGELNANWNRRELDDYQGPPNWDHRQILLQNPTAHDEILKKLRTLDRSRLRHNGSVIEAIP
jgi:hypothetical protein